jgi:DNA/RNA endonuclease YhcR with UshA esterase domain
MIAADAHSNRHCGNKHGRLPKGSRKSHADDKKPAISPSEATKKVGENVTVEMEVKSVGQSKGVFSLNSESDYKSEKNFTLFINSASAAKFKNAGIADLVEHFKGKKVRATGTVKLYKERPEIVLEDPKQIEVIEK